MKIKFWNNQKTVQENNYKNGVTFDGFYVDVMLSASRIETCDLYNADLEKALKICDCAARIVCPFGQTYVYFQPVIDAENFTCYEIEDVVNKPNNNIRMIEVEKVMEDDRLMLSCRNYCDSLCKYPLDMAEYLYDKSVGEFDGCRAVFWTLKDEIVDEIRKQMMEKDIKSFLRALMYINPNESNA